MEHERYIAKDMKKELTDLINAYPDCGISKLEDLHQLPNSKYIISYWNLGIPLYKAYGMVYADEIYKKRIEIFNGHKVGDIRNRKGIILISRELLMNMSIDLAGKLFAKLIIFKAEYKFETDMMEYYARSEEFEEIGICSRLPRYLVCLENNEISFEKVE